MNASNILSDFHLQSHTFEKVISFLQNVGYLVSFIYLMRVYLYFWEKGVLTLQKKNLLSLCINLSVIYLLTIVDMFFTIPNFFLIITCSEITTTVLLLLMSLDTCLNLRRRAKNMPPDDGSHGKLFIFYTFCGWILSQGIAYAVAYWNDNFLITVVYDFHLISYTIILILFFISLYNIKPATVNLSSSNRNFTIFGRTLIITFVTSSIKFPFVIIFYALGKQIDLLLFLDCLLAYDGVFIYYCLTFNNKKLKSRLHGTSQIHIVSNMQNSNNRNQNGQPIGNNANSI